MPQFWQKEKKIALSAINSSQCVGLQDQPHVAVRARGFRGGRSLRGEWQAPGQQLATPRCRQVQGQQLQGRDQNAEAATHRRGLAFANSALGLSQNSRAGNSQNRFS